MGDPKRRDAHRDPALREYLATLARERAIPAIVRWEQPDSMLLVAPVLTGGADWLELPINPLTADAMAERLAEKGITRLV